MTTIEGNKLIAEFMGYEIGNIKGWVSGDRGLCAFKKDGNEIVEAHPIDRLQYHSSWIWLMPVVEKIENIPPCRVIICCKSVRIVKPKGTDIKTLDDTKILSTWQAVVKFIQWHNTQTNKP